ncbi:hypothetical protein QYF61_020877 [Mycteria americana]|uniref:Uncharacterized protein n=1 Tax=Mycteria americana TaxID=33587 RepID=A0AAN7NV04_MYCAM|nr:hypothetical protein QYF61_020877 [Mycteria americana]
MHSVSFDSSSPPELSEGYEHWHQVKLPQGDRTTLPASQVSQTEEHLAPLLAALGPMSILCRQREHRSRCIPDNHFQIAFNDVTSERLLDEQIWLTFANGASDTMAAQQCAALEPQLCTRKQYSFLREQNPFISEHHPDRQSTQNKAKQPQLPQPLLIRLLLQTLHQLRCPSLHTLQHLNIPLVVGGPKLNTVFEVRPHQCRVQGHDHFPSPAGHAMFDTSQDAIGFLGHLGTLLAHIQAAVNQHPQVFLCLAAFQPLFPKPVALHGVVVTQAQDLALCLVEPHTIGLGPSIQPVQVPLQSLPALKQINTPAELGVICKLKQDCSNITVRNSNQNDVVMDELGNNQVSYLDLIDRISYRSFYETLMKPDDKVNPNCSLPGIPPRLDIQVQWQRMSRERGDGEDGIQE